MNRAKADDGVEERHEAERVGGTQVTEQTVEPVDHPAALLGQLVAPVGQEPQHGAVVLGADAAQVGLALVLYWRGA